MRVLLAEDEKELSNALAVILKHNNYSVDAVYDGQEAYEYIINGNYDIVILDIMMPKMDGISVLERVRAEGENVPIMMLTAKSEIDDRVKGLDCGADDYLTKPFAMKELLARIRVLTRRSTENTDVVLKFEDITLNRTSFLLEAPGGSIRLANKEYQMMEMLMSNPGVIISGDQFFEKIWGYDSEAEQNVVWVNLSYLRKKLQGINAHVQIKASRGLGYMLEKIND